MLIKRTSNHDIYVLQDQMPAGMMTKQTSDMHMGQGFENNGVQDTPAAKQSYGPLYVIHAKEYTVTGA